MKQFSVSPSLPAPVNPSDAASKQYVDNSVQNQGSGSYVSIAGSTMTGPLILSGAPTSPSQAATKNYVDLGLASKADLVSGTVPLSELGSVATLDVNGNVVQNANTATQFTQAATQCNGAFATGVQANGNANCSTADVIELAETSLRNHSGGQKKDAVMSFLQTALSLSDAVLAKDVVDEAKFKEGLSKVVDGTVECLNASIWAKAQ